MIVYCLYADCFGSILAPNVNVCGIRWSYAHAETRCVRTSVALVLTHAVLFFCVPFLLVMRLYFFYISLGSSASFLQLPMPTRTLCRQCASQIGCWIEALSLLHEPASAVQEAQPPARWGRWQKVTSKICSGHLETSTIAWRYRKPSTMFEGV